MELCICKEIVEKLSFIEFHTFLCYFYIIHEETITVTLSKLKPKKGTLYMIQGTLLGMFGQEQKQRTWYVYNIIDKKECCT